jgi:hypothetical protein
VPFFGVVFVRFSARAVQSSKTPQNVFGQSPCQKLFTKKLSQKKLFPVVFVSRVWPF